MQDRYVGDVGDFAKYALLRSIGGRSPSALKLAVIWYLYPNEAHNLDGRHVAYLASETYRALDPELHAALNCLVHDAKRQVAEVRKAAVLPSGTIFFEEPMVQELGLRRRGRQREALRAEWFLRAQAAVIGADIVFLDPDNGIEARSVSKRDFKAGKYVFWDEITSLWTQGHSLLIYHHLNRTMTVAMQTKALAECLAERLSRPPLLVPLLFRRGSCRHFWVIGQAEHASRLQSRINALLNSVWSEYFEVG